MPSSSPAAAPRAAAAETVAETKAAAARHYRTCGSPPLPPPPQQQQQKRPHLQQQQQQQPEQVHQHQQATGAAVPRQQQHHHHPHHPPTSVSALLAIAAQPPPEAPEAAISALDTLRRALAARAAAAAASAGDGSGERHSGGGGGGGGRGGEGGGGGGATISSSGAAAGGSGGDGGSNSSGGGGGGGTGSSRAGRAAAGKGNNNTRACCAENGDKSSAGAHGGGSESPRRCRDDDHQGQGRAMTQNHGHRDRDGHVYGHGDGHAHGHGHQQQENDGHVEGPKNSHHHEQRRVDHHPGYDQGNNGDRSENGKHTRADRNWNNRSTTLSSAPAPTSVSSSSSTTPSSAIPTAATATTTTVASHKTRHTGGDDLHDNADHRNTNATSKRTKNHGRRVEQGDGSDPIDGDDHDLDDEDDPAATARLSPRAAAFALAALHAHRANVRVAHHAVSLLAHPMLVARNIDPGSSLALRVPPRASGKAVVDGIVDTPGSPKSKTTLSSTTTATAFADSTSMGNSPNPSTGPSNSTGSNRLSQSFRRDSAKLGAKNSPGKKATTSASSGANPHRPRFSIALPLPSSRLARGSVFDYPHADPAADNSRYNQSSSYGGDRSPLGVGLSHSHGHGGLSAGVAGVGSGHTIPIRLSGAIETAVCEAMANFPFSAAFQHTALAALSNTRLGDHTTPHARDDVLLAAIAVVRRNATHPGILLRGVDLIAFHLNQTSGSASPELYRASMDIVVEVSRKLSTTPHGASAILLACVGAARWSAMVASGSNSHGGGNSGHGSGGSSGVSILGGGVSGHGGGHAGAFSSAGTGHGSPGNGIGSRTGTKLGSGVGASSVPNSSSPPGPVVDRCTGRGGKGGAGTGSPGMTVNTSAGKGAGVKGSANGGGGTGGSGLTSSGLGSGASSKMSRGLNAGPATLVDPLFCACVVSAMRKHLAVPHVQVLGCETVRVAGRIAGRILIASGAVDAVLATLELHSSDIAVVDRAIPALRAVIVDQSSQRPALALSNLESSITALGAGGPIDLCNRIIAAGEAAAAAVAHLSPDTSAAASILAVDVRNAVLVDAKKLGITLDPNSKRDFFGLRRLARRLQRKTINGLAPGGPGVLSTVSSPSDGIHDDSGGGGGAGSMGGAKADLPGQAGMRHKPGHGPKRVAPAHAERVPQKEISISALSQSIDSTSVPPPSGGFMGGIRRSASIDTGAMEEANNIHGSVGGGWADANFSAEPQQIRANRRFRSVGGVWTGKRRASRASLHSDANWPRTARDRGNPVSLSGPEVSKLVRQPSISVARASLDVDPQSRRPNPTFL